MVSFSLTTILEGFFRRKFCPQIQKLVMIRFKDETRNSLTTSEGNNHLAIRSEDFPTKLKIES